jgi:hypothetical protein
VAALRDAERDLAELHRRLMHGTYRAVPKEQLALVVEERRSDAPFARLGPA